MRDVGFRTIPANEMRGQAVTAAGLIMALMTFSVGARPNVQFSTGSTHGYSHRVHKSNLHNK